MRRKPATVPWDVVAAGASAPPISHSMDAWQSWASEATSASPMPDILTCTWSSPHSEHRSYRWWVVQ